MAFQARSYPMVPMPAPQDPIASLSNLMQFGANLENWSERRKGREQRENFDTAMRTAGGDLAKASKILNQQGDWEGANLLKAELKNLRTEAVTGMRQRFTDQNTAYGKSQSILTTLKNQPHLFPEARPLLMNYVGSVDPRLAQEIPETADLKQIEGMLQFVVKAKSMNDERLAALQLHDDAEAAADHSVDRRLKQTNSLGRFLLTTDNDEAGWNAVIRSAPGMGYPEDVIKQYGPWTPDATVRARRTVFPERVTTEPSSIQGRLVAAQVAGDKTAVDKWLGLQRRFSDAQSSGDAASLGTDPAVIQAVVDEPSVWGDVNPALRGAMIPGLVAAGFDFAAAARLLSKSQKAQIEQWHTNEISKLNQLRRQPGRLGITAEEYSQEKARIEKSYKVQLGISTPSKTDFARPGWRDNPRAGGPGAATRPSTPARSAPGPGP